MIGLLETMMKNNKFDHIASNMFGDWSSINNLVAHYNRRIWLTWRPDYYVVYLVAINVQVITCDFCISL